MPVRLHHIVVDAHDLPRLARFSTQALGWRVLSEREREVVIGPDENALVGMCIMPVVDGKTVKNRVHLDLTTEAEYRDAEIGRLLQLGARPVDFGASLTRPQSRCPTASRPAGSGGRSRPIRRETSSAWCAPKVSLVD